MQVDLTGKSALVTGASRGIGKAVVESLAAAGAYVISCARPSADLDALASCGEVWGVDATGEDILARIDALESLDILVNNAGTNKPQPFREVEDDILDQMLDLNVRSAFRIARHAARKMNRGASIVHMSSQMGHVGSPGRTVYCMTKHAIEGLTKAMAVELAGEGIRVNAVAPTFIETPMTRPMFENPDFAAFVKSMIPLGHVGQPSDVAGAVLYLCSDAAAMITGHSLLVDGGWTVQ